MFKYFSKIERLKRKARKKYRLLNSLGSRFDCGHELAKEVSGTYWAACRDMNDILDQLSEIDPENATSKRF